jgi:polyribonucleotide nucleotidyltransferase
MDAGVPIRSPVAGISIGMVSDDDDPGRYVLLTDIIGDEDHFGDMDFKVAGTQRGITALQLDVKAGGLNEQVLHQVFAQAREGRLHVLRMMLSVLPAPREATSEHAPKVVMLKINPEKIGAVIGPGGRVIRKLQEDTDSKIEIDDDGTISIAAPTEAGALAARKAIEDLTAEVEVGKIYTGRVTSVKDFGAFVEVLPGREGLVHISELADTFVENVEDVTHVGAELQVKVIGIDDQNRIRLSRKAVLRGDQDTRGEGDAGGEPQRSPRPSDRPRGHRGDRRPRGGGGSDGSGGGAPPPS